MAENEAQPNQGPLTEERKAELINQFKTSAEVLRAQLEVENLQADIEEARTRRLRSQLTVASWMAPTPDQVDKTGEGEKKSERKLKTD